MRNLWQSIALFVQHFWSSFLRVTAPVQSPIQRFWLCFERFAVIATAGVNRLWLAIPWPIRRGLIFAALIAILFASNAWVERPLVDQSVTSFYGMDQYKEGIIISCGIYIILAVSLNLVNGFTGQFSLGHIGFYAVGAYVAAAVSTYGHTGSCFRTLPVDGSPDRCRAGCLSAMLLLCLIGGLAAAAVVGICGGAAVAAAARGLLGDHHTGVRPDHPSRHSEHQSGGWGDLVHRHHAGRHDNLDSHI